MKDITINTQYIGSAGTKHHQKSKTANYEDRPNRTMKEMLIDTKQIGQFGTNQLHKQKMVNFGDIPDATNKETLIDLGLKLKDDMKIETKRMRYGQNNKLRVNHEHILIFIK